MVIVVVGKMCRFPHVIRHMKSSTSASTAALARVYRPGLNRFPFARFGGLLHGLQHPLTFHGVGESRIGDVVLVELAQELAHFMHEEVLIPDDVARRPPGLGVWLTFTRHNAAEAL